MQFDQKRREFTALLGGAVGGRSRRTPSEPRNSWSSEKAEEEMA
jgi:hypothetical protein